MKKNMFLLIIGGFPLLIRAMDSEHWVCITPPVFRIENFQRGRPLFAGFRLDLKKYYEISSELSSALSGVSQLRRNETLSEDTLELLAAKGNLRALSAFALNHLDSNNNTGRRDIVYALLEKGLAVDDNQWRPPEQCRIILDNIKYLYWVLYARAFSGDIRAYYALGDLTFVKAKLGHKAGLFLSSSIKQEDLLKLGITYYEDAMDSSQLSEQQRTLARKKCADMCVRLVQDNTMLPELADQYLRKAREYGAPDAAVAALLITRDD
jgi:hypothetical protein